MVLLLSSAPTLHCQTPLSLFLSALLSPRSFIFVPTPGLALFASTCLRLPSFSQSKTKRESKGLERNHLSELLPTPPHSLSITMFIPHSSSSSCTSSSSTNIKTLYIRLTQ